MFTHSTHLLRAVGENNNNNNKTNENNMIECEDWEWEWVREVWVVLVHVSEQTSQTCWIQCYVTIIIDNIVSNSDSHRACLIGLPTFAYRIPRKYKIPCIYKYIDQHTYIHNSTVGIRHVKSLWVTEKEERNRELQTKKNRSIFSKSLVSIVRLFSEHSLQYFIGRTNVHNCSSYFVMPMHWDSYVCVG